MVNKKMTAEDVAERLTKLETISHERWKTAFNEFSDIKQEITYINLHLYHNGVQHFFWNLQAD